MRRTRKTNVHPCQKNMLDCLLGPNTSATASRPSTPASAISGAAQLLSAAVSPSLSHSDSAKSQHSEPASLGEG